ncbi:MAG: DNA-formamidopyrimidine glycosylase family protein [Bacillota bacterium]
MIELPEAVTLARQMRENIVGRRISSAVAGASPHKFAWYSGDPGGYAERLHGRTITNAQARGGIVEVELDGGLSLWFNDGPKLRLHAAGEVRPKKHQLLIELDNGTALSSSIQMYGGLFCCSRQEMDKPYIVAHSQRPSPLSDQFDQAYFSGLLQDEKVPAMSAKAFLATEQRIPGLGNGVLQDILFSARIHPKRKVTTLTESEISSLYHAIKETLKQMADEGGRDTETDLFGQPGGYTTRLSKHTVDKPCAICGEFITKEAYMGGSIYVCPGCQKL